MEPGGFLRLSAFGGAPGAVSSTVGAGDKGSSAYSAAACGANTVLERCLQRRVIWQHRIPEPFAVQGVGIPLWADVTLGIIKEQTGPAVIVTALLSDEGAYLAQLRAGEPQCLNHCQTPA